MCEKTEKIDNPMAVIGALAKAMYASYGKDILPLFRSILREYGYQRGLELRRKLNNKSFGDKVEAWMTPVIKAGACEVVDKSPKRITVKGCACPFNLNGCGRDLCETLMWFDLGFTSALADCEVTQEIDASLAKNDERCLVTWSVP